MHNFFKFLLYFNCFVSFAQLPKGFVYADDIIADLNVELRYYTTNNFVGKVINGYESNKLILTKETAIVFKTNSRGIT